MYMVLLQFVLSRKLPDITDIQISKGRKKKVLLQHKGITANMYLLDTSEFVLRRG